MIAHFSGPRAKFATRADTRRCAIVWRLKSLTKKKKKEKNDLLSLLPPPVKDAFLSFFSFFLLSFFFFSSDHSRGNWTKRLPERFTCAPSINEFLIKPYEFNGTQRTKATMDAETLAQSRKPGPFLITRLVKEGEEEKERGRRRFLSEAGWLARPISIHQIFEGAPFSLKLVSMLKFSMLLNFWFCIYDDKNGKFENCERIREYYINILGKSEGEKGEGKIWMQAGDVPLNVLNGDKLIRVVSSYEIRGCLFVGTLENPSLI